MSSTTSNGSKTYNEKSAQLAADWLQKNRDEDPLATSARTSASGAQAAGSSQRDPNVLRPSTAQNQAGFNGIAPRQPGQPTSSDVARSMPGNTANPSGTGSSASNPASGTSTAPTFNGLNYTLTDPRVPTKKK